MDDRGEPGVATDEERVFKWRLDGLVARGVQIDDALGLAEQSDILHRLDRLLASGCELRQALQIL